MVISWPGQGVAAVAAAAAWRRAAAAVAAAATARVCWGVPSPLIKPIMGRERKGPT